VHTTDKSNHAEAHEIWTSRECPRLGRQIQAVIRTADEDDECARALEASCDALQTLYEYENERLARLRWPGRFPDAQAMPSAADTAALRALDVALAAYGKKFADLRARLEAIGFGSGPLSEDDAAEAVVRSAP